jgi:hypothetical protein
VPIFGCRVVGQILGRRPWGGPFGLQRIERSPKGTDTVNGRQCDPLLWRCFSYGRTSKTSKYKESLIYNVVNLSIPKQSTNRDLVEQIANGSHIPVESLPEDLNQPIFSRAQSFFGFAGDAFDQVAIDYDNMEWWVSDNGLNMGIVIPELSSTRIKSLDELMLNTVLSPESKETPGFESVEMPSDSEPPLAAHLQEAQKVSDPRLRKMYEAVIRHKWYLGELRALKVATKKYQTPDLLKEQFSRFEIWAVLDKQDERDIAAGDFTPGRFAWTLVKRLKSLRGEGDRTLKNYRKNLKKAGISF